MFRIGEFAQIAQVSGRQLRFYDQLGLLRPAHVDQQTGYRYYTIQQLPRLNSILALKELGLSLEQIGPLLEDKISPADLRSMLVLKRAQLERSLQEEEARLRHVESRIAQIDREGTAEGFDVIVKSVPATPFLSLPARARAWTRRSAWSARWRKRALGKSGRLFATSSSWLRETTSTPRSSTSTSAFR